MRKIREVLRLGMNCNIGNREIGRSCSISHTTVGEYLSQAKKTGLTYEQIEKLDDGELIRLLKSDPGSKAKESRPQPDWSWVHQELKRKGVTLQLLWQEYKESHPDGYQSSHFYEHYNRWKKKLNVSLRQTHKAGEKMFVDYAGQTVPVIDGYTGEIREAQLFVAVLGASNYTYSESTWTQGLSDWINSHVRTFEYFGGVPQIVVPDNLKSGVTKLVLNLFQYPAGMSRISIPLTMIWPTTHGTVIIPTRVRKPRDKAKAEVGVQIAERWILAALRNWTFFGLTELNEAISVLLTKLNNRPFKKLKGSRRSWFETIERSALLPLPQSRYGFAEWKKARVNACPELDSGSITMWSLMAIITVCLTHWFRKR